MGKLIKKILANKDKNEVLNTTGNIPKHRCKFCGRFTMWHKREENDKTRHCYWCNESVNV